MPLAKVIDGKIYGPGGVANVGDTVELNNEDFQTCLKQGTVELAQAKLPKPEVKPTSAAPKGGKP